MKTSSSLYYVWVLNIFKKSRLSHILGVSKVYETSYTNIVKCVQKSILVFDNIYLKAPLIHLPVYGRKTTHVVQWNGYRVDYIYCLHTILKDV